MPGNEVIKYKKKHFKYLELYQKRKKNILKQKYLLKKYTFQKPAADPLKIK